jgi:hypothetical protein
VSNVAGDFGVTNYKACGGSNWGWGVHSPVSGLAGRYQGDTNGLEHGNGLICRGGNGQPVVTALSDVRDGMGQTIAVGEAVPGWSRHTWWYWFNGSTATCAIPLNYNIPGDSTTEPDDAWHDNYSFMSRHPGGGHFCMVDGSSHFISNAIDRSVYRSLATIDGGELVTEY